MKPLSDLLQGEYGYIVDLRDKNVITQLFDLGCFPGDLIRVVENLPSQPFITFRYRKTIIHLDRSKAENIMTNAVSYYFCLN